MEKITLLTKEYENEKSLFVINLCLVFNNYTVKDFLIQEYEYTKKYIEKYMYSLDRDNPKLIWENHNDDLELAVNTVNNVIMGHEHDDGLI